MDYKINLVDVYISISSESTSERERERDTIKFFTVFFFNFFLSLTYFRTSSLITLQKKSSLLALKNICQWGKTNIFFSLNFQI